MIQQNLLAVSSLTIWIYNSSVVRYHGTTAAPFFYSTSTVAFTVLFSTTSTAVLEHGTCPFLTHSNEHLLDCIVFRLKLQPSACPTTLGTGTFRSRRQWSGRSTCHTGILLWFYRTRASNRYNCNYGSFWNKIMGKRTSKTLASCTCV